MIGVDTGLQEPHYHQMFVQPSDEPLGAIMGALGQGADVIWKPALPCAKRKLLTISLPKLRFYAIIASDGIWEFIDYSKASDLTAKKPEPQSSKGTQCCNMYTVFLSRN